MENRIFEFTPKQVALIEDALKLASKQYFNTYTDLCKGLDKADASQCVFIYEKSNEFADLQSDIANNIFDI